MNYFYAFLFCVLLISCHSQNILSYEQGLAKCSEIEAEKKKDNPNGLSFIGPECMIGAQLPDFKLTSIKGSKIDHQSLKGKVSIINFWFTSCTPCIAEIPGFNAIVERFGTDQINYIAIGRDEPGEIKEFLKDHPWKFEQVANGNETIKKDFQIQWGYPTTFVVDKNAKIVLAFSGGKTDSTAAQEIQNKLIPVIEKELK